MLFVTVIIVHVILSLFLIGVILLQGGRGGLGEALGGAAAQSLFGGGANTVMTKITSVSAVLFMVTCLGLAALSTAQGRSVVDRLPAALPSSLPPIPGMPATEPGHPAAGGVGEGVPPVPSSGEGMPKAEGQPPSVPSATSAPAAPVPPPSSDSAPQ